MLEHKFYFRNWKKITSNWYNFDDLTHTPSSNHSSKLNSWLWWINGWRPGAEITSIFMQLPEKFDWVIHVHSILQITLYVCTSNVFASLRDFTLKNITVMYHLSNDPSSWGTSLNFGALHRQKYEHHIIMGLESVSLGSHSSWDLTNQTTGTMQFIITTGSPGWKIRWLVADQGKHSFRSSRRTYRHCNWWEGP